MPVDDPDELFNSHAAGDSGEFEVSVRSHRSPPTAPRGRPGLPESLFPFSLFPFQANVHPPPS